MNICCRLLAVTTTLLSCCMFAAAGDLSIVHLEVPATLDAGSVTTVSIVVANDGSLVWSQAEGFALSYHWLNADHETVIWDGLRTAFPEVVAPGASVGLDAIVEAPRRPGDYLLVWDVVQEGVRWISDIDGEGPRPVEVSVSSGYSFKQLEGSMPPIMISGSETAVRLVLRNDGEKAWLADGSFALAFHWLSGSDQVVRSTERGAYWEGRRSPFPTVVSSGETVALEAVVTAPDRSGLWHLQWDVVEEGVSWFSDRMPQAPPTVSVLVVPDPLASAVWWSVVVLLAAITAVSAWWSGGRRTLVILVTYGDVLWCVGALSIKQVVVLSEFANPPTPAGWVLIVAGASVLALMTRLAPERFRGWACWGLVAVGSAVLWADTLYCRFFGDLPSLAALAGAGQLSRVEASIRALATSNDLWLWLDLLPGAVLVLLAGRVRRQSALRASKVVVIGLLFVSTVGGLTAVGVAVRQPHLLAQMFRRVVVAKDIGILNLHVVDGVEAIARSMLSRKLEPNRLDKITDWFRDRTPERAGTGRWFAVAEGANLVMVQVESLQNFVIGLEIGGQKVTPFLDRWAREALWFSNVTDQTGQGRSSDSELATQASLLPMTGGAAVFRFGTNDFTGMAEALAMRGYHTVSAVPYEGSFWNRRRTHPALGFRRNLFVEDFETGENIGWGLSDRDFLRQAARELLASEQPFAAYLLTLSLHHPFAGFPAHLKELDVGTWSGTPFGNFLHTMHYFDASLAAFVADLERGGIADNTVVAIWGDHDAGFQWRPEIASAMGATYDAAGWYLSQEVPLIIKVPNVEALRGERAVPAGHTDVAPTLLALLGVDPAPFAYLGRNLLGNHGDRPVVGEYGCWRNLRHLYLQGDGTLDDGTCIELASMAPVENSACREAFEEAVRIEENSALVLEHDLQRAIHRDLARGSERNQ
jgi:lipoteichoic acid synthase